MTGETIAKVLGGHRAGATWMARCPAHDDSGLNLSISAGRHGNVLVLCHAGCGQRDVIASLSERGLWDATVKRLGRSAHKRRKGLAAEPNPDATARTEFALSIWRASKGIVGSPGETYLRWRGITLSSPPRLRFHPGLKHSSGGVWPAMVALVVHRIVITPTLNREGRHRRSSKGPLFDASYEGEVIVVGSTEPCLDSARVLKAGGLTGRLEMCDSFLPYPLFHADIEKAAGLTIEEGERQPRLRRYVSRGGGMAKYGDFASGGIPVAQTGESRPSESPVAPTGNPVGDPG